jgi:hypothetical protein
MYIDYLSANGELTTKIASSANSLLLESSSQIPVIKKTYSVRLDCVPSKIIEVF